MNSRVVGPICVLLLATAAFAGDPVGWGADINAGSGPKLIEGVRPALAAIVAAGDDRDALIADFVAKRGLADIEAVKRFRNPELYALFVALLDHEDWHVKHRALYALEYYGKPEVVGRAWALATHKAPRMREKAVLTALRLWAGKPSTKEVAARLAVETDPHVRACLEALHARTRKKLPVDRVYEEVVVTGPDGLTLTPFLSGMNNARKVAPGFTPKRSMKGGGGKASKGGASKRWTGPILGWGEEEVSGTSLQPFANLRRNGTYYHLGQDVGACLDGAGYYAIADGVVRLVSGGSDMGTLIVTQHSPDGKMLVNSVNMHGGDTVYVKPGEKVRCGQLLGTMGMGYSIENGGHFAHLHFGLYSGTYSDTHNYGYRPVKAGFGDWLDPEKFLPPWMERSAPLITGLPERTRANGRVLDAIDDGELGKAFKALGRLKDEAEKRRFTKLLTDAIDTILARAESQRKAGHADWADRFLAEQAKKTKGIPGADRLR
ncbi:MAG: HEAT repeat domain-containing protein [Planctomycetota bacterium]